jgi:endonuclease/exonuclease/phosphatase family metal-dependent hydrolase
MESYLEDGPVQAVQLDRMFARLRGAEHALLLGDLNFGDGEPESSHLEAGYEDRWIALHPGLPGYTWDIDRSDLARDSSFRGEPSRRLDRVLLRSSVWRGGAVTILGDRPVHPGKTDLFPSDHFGLLADLVHR